VYEVDETPAAVGVATLLVGKKS